jgi:energy-coupling factor transporter ATP-binding protein EcfA2
MNRVRIDLVYAENFKGLNFEQPLTDKVLLTGPNGSGKTARMQALCLALTGAVPGVCTSLPGSVLKMFAGENTHVTVGVVHNSTVYERKYIRAGKTGSLQGRINDVLLLPAEFNARAAEILPDVFNLSGFLGMSDPEKLKFLSQRFSAGETETLNLQIAGFQKRISDLRADIRARYRMIEASRNAQSGKKRPPGTVAENRNKQTQMLNEIAQTMADLKAEKLLVAQKKKESHDANAKKGRPGKDTAKTEQKACLETVRRVFSLMDKEICGLECPIRKEMETWGN